MPFSSSDSQNNLPLPPNGKQPTNPREYLHTAPRWFWGILVVISTTAIVVSFLLILQLFGPSSLKIGNWLGLSQSLSQNSATEVKNYNECVNQGGHIIKYFPDNCLWNGVTYKNENKIVSNNNSSDQSSLSAETNTGNQTYVNPYFPSLNIVYNDSWNFSTTTEGSQIYSDLVMRTIRLKKNDAVITIYTRPIIPTGCGYEQNFGTKIAGNVGKTYNRYTFDTTGIQYYVPNNRKTVFSCVSFYHSLNSTIRSESYDKIMKPEPVRFSIWATVQTNNSSLILEADEIMKNSTLFDSVSFN